MNLVYEKHRTRLKIRENSSKVTCALYRHTGRTLKRCFQGSCHQVSERRLPNARRPIEEKVLRHVATLLRCLENDLHIGLYVALSDIVVPLPRSQCAIKRLIAKANGRISSRTRWL